MPPEPICRTWRQARNIPAARRCCSSRLEMAAQQLSARILSEQTEIEVWKIRNGKFSRKRMGEVRPHHAGPFHPAALYRRHRRHLHRPDRGPRPAPEARKEYRSDHHRLSAAGRAVAPPRKPGAGNHRSHQGTQDPGQGIEHAGPGVVAAVARRGLRATTSARCCRICANPAPSSRTPTW